MRAGVANEKMVWHVKSAKHTKKAWHMSIGVAYEIGGGCEVLLLSRKSWLNL